MPRNWLQKVCDQLAPTSLSKVQRRPRGRMPMPLEPLETRSLLAAPVFPGGQNFEVGENIGVLSPATYTDPVTGTVQVNTVAGTFVGNLTASDPENEAIQFSQPGFNSNSPFAISGSGVVTVNNPGAINYEESTSITLNVQVRDVGAMSPANTTGTVTITVLNRNDIPLIPDQQAFATPENSVAGTVVGTVQASQAMRQTPGNLSSVNPNNPNGTFNLGERAKLPAGQNDSGVSANNDDPFLPGDEPPTPTRSTLRFEILRARVDATPGNPIVQTISKPSSLQNKPYGPFLPNSDRPKNFVLSFKSTRPISEVDGSVAQDEVQTLNMGGVPNTTRFFTLTFNNQTTRQLHYNIQAAPLMGDPPGTVTLQSELEQLSSIGAGNVQVANGPGGTYVITFKGSLSKQNLPAIEVTAFTDALDYTDSAATIQAALQGLPTIGAGNVTVANNAPAGTGWVATFSGPVATPSINTIGIINVSDLFEISNDVTTLGRITVSPTANPYLIGSRSDGQAGVVSGVEFLRTFFGATAPVPDVYNTIDVLVRVKDQSYTLPAGNGQAVNVDPDDPRAIADAALNNRYLPTNDFAYDEYVTVTLTDQSESSPIVKDYTGANGFEIDENDPATGSTPAGTLVGRIDDPVDPTDVTSKEDPPVAKTYSYSIVPGIAGGNLNALGANIFAINSQTSEITVNNAAALSYETQQSYRILVRVTDNATPFLSTEVAVDIAVKDVNEPTTIPSGQLFQVAENSPIGTLLGTVNATDLDNSPPRQFTYEIVSGNTGDAFEINSTNGKLTVKNNIPLQTPITLASYTLGIRVYDRDQTISSATNTIQIDVVPANTVAPIVSDQSFDVNEDHAVGGLAIGNVVAVTTGTGQTVSSFQILTPPGQTPPPFVIASNGDIFVNGALDYETSPIYQFVVRVADNRVPSPLISTATVTINVKDVNEQITMNSATYTIAENTSAGNIVGNLVTDGYVADPDDPQGKVFSIISGNTGNAFSINASSGEITVQNPTAIDYETLAPFGHRFTLVIQVKDINLQNALQSTTATNTVFINVTDANDAPVLNDQAMTVQEHRLPNTLVGTVAVSDQDAGQLRSFQILGGNIDNAFAIDAATGQITIQNPGAVDRDQHPNFFLLVQVTDNGNPALSDTGIVTISIQDMPLAPILNDQTLLLPENSAAGTVVGNLGLISGTAPFNYTVTGNTGNTFAVDPATGNITVANPTLLNFETNPTFVLTVTVVDSASPQLTDNATITINLTEVNEQPTIDSPSFLIAENSAVGTVVGAVTGTDVDAGQTLTYAITGGNASGAFAINAVTGQITVANSAALNFETNPQFVLSVTATDNGAPALTSATGFVTINLTDQPENPVVTNATVNLPENSPAGTLVHNVLAADQDSGATLTYAFIGGNRNNTFAINATTGEITVANPAGLDFENEPPYLLNIRVTDNTGRSGFGVIIVRLTDVNDAPVVFNHTVTIQENPAVGALVLDYKLIASDRDRPAQTLTYAIIAGNTSGAFVIDANTGLITVANPTAVDAELNPSFGLTVRVTDNGVPSRSSTALLTVNVGNVNDPPVIANKSVTLAENSAAGTVVTNAGATDPEGQALTYAITGGNFAGNGLQNIFAINPSTGVITVANPQGLDWENQPPYNLQVTVTDSGTPALSSVATIRVTLTNVNDAPSVYNHSKAIPENLPAGSLVLDYKLIAKDQDAGQTLTYAIIGGNTSNAFVIDSSTGLITVSNPAAIDFETNPQFNLQIRVTDNGVPSLSSTATLVLNVTNLNDAPTVPPQAFNLVENSPNGTVVGTVTATDGDVGQTRTFAITGGNTNGAFAINAATGQIRVNNTAAIDFETSPVFNLTISVTDSGSPAATGSGVVTITLQNVNDAPTILPQTFSVAENSSAGVLVGNVIAVEADANQSITYAIVGGNTLNAFAINSTTGALTVNTPSALNFEATPQFQLTVRVTDNGLPAQQRTAVITVNLTNVNEAPKFAVANANFTIAENSPAGTVVGQNGATDPDGQLLTYAIISGNTNNAFSVDSQGRILVNNAAALDFETGPNSFNLVVRATDPGNLQATANVLVIVSNANDAPVVQPKAFSINENSANGAFIGNITATDQDPGQTRTFAITGGNVNGAFAISSTGALSVANSAALNFETNPIFTLTVTATDNGNPARSGSAQVQVFLRDLNEAPIVPAQQMAVQTRSPANTVVGTVQATDPEGGTRTFAIVSGNGVFNNAFRINATTGVITVNNALAVSFNGQYNLGIRVTDNGNPALSTTGNVQVFVNSTGTVPRVAASTASSNGTSASGIVAQQTLSVQEAKPVSTVTETTAKPKSIPFLSLFKKK